MISPYRPPFTTLQRAILTLGSLGPLGHLPASGTVTVAVVGLPLFYLGSNWTLGFQTGTAAVIVLAAMVIHQIGDRILGDKDSRTLVWDELAGFWIAVLGVPFTWQLAAAAFLIERAFDIAKIPPAGWIERRWPGAWGVVGDDVVAGLYACALLHAGMRWAPGFFGLS